MNDDAARHETEKPSEQALLTEYEACEDYADSAAGRDWQIAGIIWAAALVGLFLVAFADNDLASAIMTTVLFVFVTLTLRLFWAMLERMIFLQIACRRRMREIERQLRMRNHIYLYLLDNWQTREESEYWKYLSEEERRVLEKDYLVKGKGVPRMRTTSATNYINWAIVGAWFLVFILRWLSYGGVI